MSELKKKSEKVRSDWVGSERTDRIGSGGSDPKQSRAYESKKSGEENLSFAEMSGGLTRDEEARRGNILRRKRERGRGGGVNRYLCDCK